MKLFLLSILILSQGSFSESLSSLNKKVNQSTSPKATSSNTATYSNNYSEQGGYTTEIHILGAEKKFDRIRFSQKKFDQWTQLFVSAQSYDLIAQLKDNNDVNFDGTLKETVKSLVIPLEPNRVINRKVIEDYYSQKYNSGWIFNQLKQVGVLDSQGFLMNTRGFSEVFNPNDFNQYKTKIERINFNFSNSAISYAMQDELLRVLKQNSIVVHVLQEETTRYQSRESGFFESFLDQLGGNALGSLFYKDKINTVKQKIGYSPNINIFSLFTNIKFGFAQAPYAKGARGNMIYYGKNNQNAFHFNVSNDNSNQSQTHYGAQISILNQWADLPLEEETVLASGIRVDVNEIRDNTGHLTWMSISYQKLQLKHFSFDHSFSLGVSNYSSSFRGDSQLGIALGIDGTYHIIPYLGIFYGLESNLGFDLFNTDNQTTWQISHYFLGVETAIAPVQFRLGYEWIMGENQSELFDGMTLGVGIYF
ncbi:MAG: hypothetical protein VW397_02940 [Candidatus Margulisiibacteriota bacterium]